MDKTEKSIIISGAGGFLGNTLIEYLLSSEKEIQVYALTSQKERLLHLYGNYTRFKVVDSVPENVDVLVNCAFPRNADGICFAQGLSYIENLYRTASERNIRAVINISSQSVYSQRRELAANEQETLNLESKYAVAKYAVELLTNSIFFNIPHTNLRMASLIGRGFDQRITNQFIKQVKAGNDIKIVKTKQKFGFLDSRDAAEAIMKVIFSDQNIWKEIYNLGNYNTYQLSEIAEKVIALCNEYHMKRKIIVDGEETERKNSSLDAALFFKEFQWTPKFQLEDTLRWIFEAM